MRQRYRTSLPLGMVPQFYAWLKANNIPYDDLGGFDYDMPGFYLGLRQGHPAAQAAVDPYDSQMHFSDYWKTPSHTTFSAESRYSPKGAPGRFWANDRLLNPDLSTDFDPSNAVDQLWGPRHLDPQPSQMDSEAFMGREYDLAPLAPSPKQSPRGYRL